MKVRNKKIVSLMIAGLIVLMMFSSFAIQQFTDVAEDYWAEPYISRVTSSEVMPGFDDATFKPKALATKMEVIVSVYRMLNASGKLSGVDTAELVTKYQSVINQYNIKEELEPYGKDNHKAIAVALEYKIIEESELESFLLEGNFVPAQKLETAVYVGKALNSYLNVDARKIFRFSYTDKFDISFENAPYVDLLIENDILSSTGDENGRFNAKANVNRDVLTVFIAGSLNTLDGIVGSTPLNEGTTTPSDNDVEAVVSGSFTGTVSLVHTVKNIVEIRDVNSKLHVYSLDNTVITKNGATVELVTLESGQKISYKVTGMELTNITITQDYDKIKGSFQRISDLITEGLEKYRVLTIKDTDGKFQYKKIFLTTAIEKDYDLSTFDNYKIGDTITVSFDGYNAKKVEGFSTESVVTGVVNRSTDFTEGSAVSIKLGGDNYIEEILKTDVEVIKINNENLIKGDIVKAYLENGKIVKIEATGLSSEDKGTVVEITIGEKSYVSIERESGVIKKYSVSNNVVMNNLGTIDSNGIYALRLEQDITVSMDGVLVNNISVNKSVEKSKFQGSVVEVHKTSNIVKVKDDNGVVWVVSLNGDSSMNISDFTINDKVYVYGVKLSNDLFEAELMIILE